jgi:hypothetical protein
VPTRLNVRIPQQTNLVLFQGGILQLSPDGRKLALRTGGVGEGAQSRLQLRDLGGLDFIEVPSTEGVTYDPFFSPDGRWLAFANGSALLRVATSGGTPLSIADNALRTRGGTWAPDGTVYLGFASGPLRRVAATGGELEPVFPLDEEAGEMRHHYPIAVDDGSHLVFIVRHGDDDSLWLGDTRSLERTRLLDRVSKADIIGPDVLIFSRPGGDVWASTLDIDRRRLGREPVLVLQGQFDSRDGRPQYTVSRSGNLAYVRAGGSTVGDGHLVWVD